MSCDHRRTAFFSHASITGVGTPAATTFGDPASAQQILRDLFDTAANQPPLTDPVQQRLAAARTRLLFLRFQHCGIAIPTHAASGLPSAQAQHAYAIVQTTLHALETGAPLPELAQQIVAARRTTVADTITPAKLDEALQLAAATRSNTGVVLPAARDRLMQRLPVVAVQHAITAATLRSFTAHAFGRATDAITLAQPDGAGLHGVSGDAVFLVRDERNMVIGAVKAFKSQTMFAAELSAMQRLAAPDAHGIAAPQLRAVAAAPQAAGVYGLLAMQAAPG